MYNNIINKINLNNLLDFVLKNGIRLVKVSASIEAKYLAFLVKISNFKHQSDGASKHQNELEGLIARQRARTLEMKTKNMCGDIVRIPASALDKLEDKIRSTKSIGKIPELPVTDDDEFISKIHELSTNIDNYDDDQLIEKVLKIKNTPLEVDDE